MDMRMKGEQIILNATLAQMEFQLSWNSFSRNNHCPITFSLSCLECISGVKWLACSNGVKRKENGILSYISLLHCAAMIGSIVSAAVDPLLLFSPVVCGSLFFSLAQGEANRLIHSAITRYCQEMLLEKWAHSTFLFVQRTLLFTVTKILVTF